MNIQDRATASAGIASLASLIWQNPSAEFIERLPIAIYACDAQGRILWFNTRAAELWGRAPRIGDDSELYCGSYKLYFDGPPVSREQTPMAQVLKTGASIRGIEARVERPDGSHVRAVAHIAPVLDADGSVVGAINCFHERIGGERLEAVDGRPQDWIRARDERLASSYEQVGAGIVEVDRDGRMLSVNQQLCRLTGHAASELLGRTIFQETLPEDVSEDRAKFDRQVAGEIDRYSVEKRIYRKDGGHIWASVTSSSIRNGAGDFLYAVRVQHDITDRKRAEQDLTRRKEEQAALFEFSQRLQHCISVEQVYDAALDAITRALNCKRASILLFELRGCHAVRRVAGIVPCLQGGGRRTLSVASRRNRSASGLRRTRVDGRAARGTQSGDPRRRHRGGGLHSDRHGRTAFRKIHGLPCRAPQFHRGRA